MRRRTQLQLLIITVGMTHLGASDQAYGGATSSSPSSIGLLSITSISHTVSGDGVETLTLSGLPGSITIQNQSNQAAAARLIATCFKSALTVKSGSGLIFSLSSENLTTSTSQPIYYSGSSPHYTFTISSAFPSSGSDVEISCSVETTTTPSL